MTDKYQTILVPLDGSDQAEKAFEEGIAVADRNDAKLFLISVINDSELSTSAYSFSKLFNMEKERMETDMLKKIQAAHEAGIEDVEAFVELGNPKSLIVEFAENNGIDLILMGATGKGRINQMLVGSTTSYVVNNAPCNVMVVK